MSGPISNDINDPVLESILKYKDHPSIKAIEKIANQTAYLNFLMWKKGKY